MGRVCSRCLLVEMLISHFFSCCDDFWAIEILPATDGLGKVPQTQWLLISAAAKIVQPNPECRCVRGEEREGGGTGEKERRGRRDRGEREKREEGQGRKREEGGGTGEKERRGRRDRGEREKREEEGGKGITEKGGEEEGEGRWEVGESDKQCEHGLECKVEGKGMI